MWNEELKNGEKSIPRTEREIIRLMVETDILTD